MMGALVNVRRGGRSPPLLMVALVACILLFGFNYWVSSSRNVELQTKLLELEEAVRRVSAEKAREQMARSEAEEQVHRQTQELALMEGAHHRRQQSAQNMWNEEKESLLLNISSNAKTIQDMKDQMKSLREDLSKMQKELQSCKNNMNTLNKKLTYDMTQCNTQILAQKEECNEKLAAAKLEVQKKFKRQNEPSDVVQPASDSTQKAVVTKNASEALGGKDSTKSLGEPQKMEPAPEKTRSDEHQETNEIPQDQAALLDAAAVTKVKEEEAIEYDNEGEIEKRLSKLKDEKSAVQELEEELADYNGDDENEPEFEADKQAELAEV
ncbi:Golgi membrane protein 1 isoform X2 [Hemibagrus wyckioides]|uniref:Golgi membrane protein 1 isoform X2 n=1 Tax=Hemibagrus wyckioides TaxID=337641 RepID=UPI00266BFC76|nr:Golgi membrane protein 1 isoform X2 [Hemibagrus wyckioides]